MYLEVPYATLLRDYPEAIEEALGSLRKGRSKHRGDPPESFQWGLSWCVRIQSFSLEDLVTRKAVAVEQTIEEKLSDYSRNCGVTIKLSKGRGSWYSELLAETPQAILDLHRASLEKNAQEQARVDALTPEERDRELEGLLKQLRGPGFMAIKL